MAAKREVPRAQVALAWLLGKPGVDAPIVGATKVSHLEDAVAAVDLRLDDSEVDCWRRTTTRAPWSGSADVSVVPRATTPRPGEARTVMELNRRQFITGAAVTVAGTLSLSAMGAGSVAATRFPAALPPPEQSGIDHIVVVMMENRSFDHYLGWLPGADGKQDGLSYVDNSGGRHATHHLDTFTGCGHPDPDHSYEGGRVQYNGGACDGFLRSGRNDEFAIGYYSATDLDFFGRAARDWTTCDRYFAAVMGPTFPNRFFQHAAQTDRISNLMEVTTIATIWDRLAERGIPAKYYFCDVADNGSCGARSTETSRSRSPSSSLT